MIALRAVRGDQRARRPSHAGKTSEGTGLRGRPDRALVRSLWRARARALDHKEVDVCRVAGQVQRDRLGRAASARPSLSWPRLMEGRAWARWPAVPPSLSCPRLSERLNPAVRERCVCGSPGSPDTPGSTVVLLWKPSTLVPSDPRDDAAIKVPLRTVSSALPWRSRVWRPGAKKLLRSCPNAGRARLTDRPEPVPVRRGGALCCAGVLVIEALARSFTPVGGTPAQPTRDGSGEGKPPLVHGHGDSFD